MTTSTTTPIPDVSAPPGALVLNEWQPSGYRIFEGEQRDIEQVGLSEQVSVWTFGHQLADGSIVNDRVPGEWGEITPGIAISGVQWEEPLTAATARHLADLLVTAADQIDGWVK